MSRAYIYICILNGGPPCASEERKGGRAFPFRAYNFFRPVRYACFALFLISPDDHRYHPVKTGKLRRRENDFCNKQSGSTCVCVCVCVASLGRKYIPRSRSLPSPRPPLPPPLAIRAVAMANSLSPGFYLQLLLFPSDARNKSDVTACTSARPLSAHSLFKDRS